MVTITRVRILWGKEIENFHVEHLKTQKENAKIRKANILHGGRRKSETFSVLERWERETIELKRTEKPISTICPVQVILGKRKISSGIFLNSRNISAQIVRLT